MTTTETIRRIVFDVDGVLCDNSDLNIPYYERPPYPFVADRLLALKEKGYQIILQTARGMCKFSGDQRKCDEYHRADLTHWLHKHGIPFDELYFGKADGQLYVDDRAFRLRSGDGLYGWEWLRAVLG